jgi:hypothetical protein
MQTILLSSEHSMMAQFANALASLIAFGALNITYLQLHEILKAYHRWFDTCLF